MRMAIEKYNPSKKYTIQGKGDAERKKRVSRAIENIKFGPPELIEGELKKTPEQLKMIEKANEHINEELDELDIKKRSNILLGKVHFLSGNIFNETFDRHKDKSAVANCIVGEIFINLDMYFNKSELYNTILHECLHIVSAEKYIFDDREFWQKRTGYWESRDTKGHDHFQWFNEMIITKVSNDIFKKHKKEITEKKEPIYGYILTVLNLVIDKVAKYNQETPEDTWKRLKKGLFTGEMMHLRDVDRTFGKGSLRLIASLYSGTKESIDKQIAYSKILKYLSTKDEEKKEKIAQEILIDREWEAYKKHKGLKNK